ncbi:hypothetical protein [Marinactinospora rubrisoli]|uniref:MFS transporter n=1 Tax=Marinactinospora rubrisoli TaxID=2715399 RepID=A0ABW2KI04_9ACTN
MHVTSQSVIYALRPDAGSRLIAGHMVCYSIGSAIGALAATAGYAAGGWPAVCLLGGAFSAAAFLWWALTARGGRSIGSAPGGDGRSRPGADSGLTGPVG